MLQGIGSILGALAVFAAAAFATQTYKTWRAQKIAERRVDQAERILTATYNARRRLDSVRSPAIWSGELKDAESLLKERGEWDRISGDDAKKKAAEAQVYYTRLEGADDARHALRECLPMARALFSEELEKALEGLHHQFHTVAVYVDANRRDKAEADRPFRQKIEQTIWAGYPSPEVNYMDTEIKAQVDLIEGTCVPAIRFEAEAADRAPFKFRFPRFTSASKAE